MILALEALLRHVTLSPSAEFILSVAEGLRAPE